MLKVTNKETKNIELIVLFKIELISISVFTLDRNFW